MGQRSAEALARRAAKRGRTVEEQAKIDAQADSKRTRHGNANDDDAAAPTTVVAAPAPAPAAAPKPVAVAAPAVSGPVDVTVGRPVWKLDELPEGVKLKKKDEKAGWVCMGRPGQTCGFVNFAFRTTCKQCDAVRLSTDEGKKKAKKEKKAADKTKRGPPSQRDRKAESASADDAGGSASAAWAGTNLAGAAEANAVLRAQFKADPASLSDADQERARALLARDERKQQSKAARKAAISHAEAQGGGAGAGGGKGKGKGKGDGGGKGGGRGKGMGKGASFTPTPGFSSTTRGPAPGSARSSAGRASEPP